MTLEKPIGVTMGWDGDVHLAFRNGFILWGDADKTLYPEYWEAGKWPVDPETKEQLPIYKGKMPPPYTRVHKAQEKK